MTSATAPQPPLPKAPDVDGPPQPGLRVRSLSGAIALSIRQVLGIVLGLGGVLVLTHTLGPSGYGVYAVALGITVWMQTLADWGVGVYLVRTLDTPAMPVPMQVIEAQGFTVLMALSAAGTAVGIGALLVFGHLLWNSQIVATAAVLVASTPLVLAAQVPMARLEREMAYSRVATTEVMSQVSLYLVAIPLVLLGAGAWAPTIGMVVSRLVLLVGAAVVTRWRPRWHWDAALARDVLGYGFGFSASVTVWQLRGLALPVVVAPFAGPAAAGQVALAVRLVETAGFVKSAVWRLGLAALARVQDDASRTCRAVRDGAVLQMAGLGLVLGSIALLCGGVISALFGSRWEPVEHLFPLIAFGAVANGAFNLHSSALYARRINWSVTWFHVAHVTLFLGGGVLAVRAWGAIGYGIAELVALPAYAVLWGSYSRWVGPLELDVILPWLVAVAGIMAAPIVGPWSLVLIAALAMPRSFTVTRDLAAALRAVLRGKLPWRPRSAF